MKVMACFLCNIPCTDPLAMDFSNRKESRDKLGATPKFQLESAHDICVESDAVNTQGKPKCH
jgi:hypothetical protein